MTFPVRPVTVVAQIPASPDEVFELVSDTRNDHLWCPNVADATQAAGEGVAVGSTFTFTQTISTRGRTLESDVTTEVVDLGHNSIEWRVEDRFQTRQITLRVDPDGAGSKITQTTIAEFKRKPGVAKWVYPMLAKRTFRDQFERLRNHYADS